MSGEIQVQMKMPEYNAGNQIVRIDSVDDPKQNRELFNLYKKLVKPMEALEGLMLVRDRDEMALLNIPDHFKVYGPTVGLTIFYLVADFLVFVFTMINPKGHDAMASFVEGRELTTLQAWLIVFAPAIVLTLVTMLLRTIIKNISNKKKYKYYTEEKNEAERKIGICLQHLTPALQYVPPKYRFSEALEYMADSYANSRVDNLKEAVNLYDTYEFRNEMKEGMQLALQRLQNIEYLQEATLNRLSAISADIWLSNMIFN